MVNEDFEMSSATSHQSNEERDGARGYQSNRKISVQMLNLDDLQYNDHDDRRKDSFLSSEHDFDNR